MKEEQAVMILFNRLRRVASARDEVGGIKLKPDVFRI